MIGKCVSWFAGKRGCVVVCSCLVAFCGCNKGEEAIETSGRTVEMTAEAPSPDVSKADGGAVVVEVNGEKLTRAEVDADVERALAYQQSRGMPPQMLEGMRDQMEKQAIERFVGKSVLLAEAARREIEVTEKDVTDKLDELKKRLPGGLTLDAALSQQGMTIEGLKQDIMDDLKIRSVVDSCTNDLPAVTEAEITEFYTNSLSQFQSGESAQARHILLKCDGTNETVRAEKKAEIEGYRKQLLEGGDFEALAKEHSDCPSGQKGGDLGTFERGQMVKPFEDAAFSQEINAVGPVVETKFGYHIIQVLARNEASTKSLSEVHDDIKKYLGEKGKQAKIESYVESLKKEADVKYAEAPTAVQ